MSDPSLPAPAPPADWYPDPSGRWDYRYWNGHSWTAHVSRAGTAYVDQETAHLPTGHDGPSEATVPRATTQQGAGEPAGERPGFLGRLVEEHREERAERTAVEDLVRRSGDGDDQAAQALPAAVAKVSPAWLERNRVTLFAEAVRHALHDDLLDLPDSARLGQVSQALGTSLDDLRRREPDTFDELVIGQINDGRLPVVSEPPILTRRGESVHGVFRVDLLKEVAVREFHGGSSGVSVPLGMGVRYRVGAFRGHSEVVGSELVAQDAGVLAVTSTRTVFSGQRKTLEFRHDRLVDLQQYTDGLRFNVTGRQTASLFRFARGSSPSVAAALIAAVRQEP
ncbi:MAG TPA: DUF2510 domain-containing protein [Marmoricola sp.]|nr:DUF2510 domain-containing protein [Marmoricola sp.]